MTVCTGVEKQLHILPSHPTLGETEGFSCEMLTRQIYFQQHSLVVAGFCILSAVTHHFICHLSFVFPILRLCMFSFVLTCSSLREKENNYLLSLCSVRNGLFHSVSSRGWRWAVECFFPFFLGLVPEGTWMKGLLLWNQTNHQRHKNSMGWRCQL